MGQVLLLDKNYNNKISTEKGFLVGKFMDNDFWGRDNNNDEERNDEIGGKIENKKRKIEDEERMAKLGKMRYNDDKNNDKDKLCSIPRDFKANGRGRPDTEIFEGGDAGRRNERNNDSNDDDNKEDNKGNNGGDENIGMGLDGGSDEERNEEEDVNHGGRCPREEEEFGGLDAGSSTEADDRGPGDDDAKGGAKNEEIKGIGVDSDRWRVIGGVNEWETEEGGEERDGEGQGNDNEMKEEDEDEWEDVIEESDGEKVDGREIIRVYKFRFICLRRGRILNGMRGRKKRPDWKERWISSYHEGGGSKWEYSKRWGWEDWSRYREKWWWRDEDWEDFVEEEEEEWTEEEEREYLEEEEKYRREAEERWDRLEREEEKRRKVEERDDKVEVEDEEWWEEKEKNSMDDEKGEWTDHDEGYNGLMWDNNGSDSDKGERGKDVDINNNNYNNNKGVEGFREEEDGWWERGCRYYFHPADDGNENGIRSDNKGMGRGALRVTAKEYIPARVRKEMEELNVEESWLKEEEERLMTLLKDARRARAKRKRERIESEREGKAEERRLMGLEEERSRCREKREGRVCKGNIGEKEKEGSDAKTRLLSGRVKVGILGGKVLKD